MPQFFKAIKYISSLETLEYRALKQDSLKIKSLFLVIAMIIGRISLLIMIYFLIKLNIFAVILCLIVGIAFSFLSYYLRMYWALQNQLGNPFYRNDSAK